jgi:hypothetical protein
MYPSLAKLGNTAAVRLWRMMLEAGEQKFTTAIYTDGTLFQIF